MEDYYYSMVSYLNAARTVVHRVLYIMQVERDYGRHEYANNIYVIMHFVDAEVRPPSTGTEIEVWRPEFGKAI